MPQTVQRFCILTAILLFVCGSFSFAGVKDSTGGKISMRKVNVQKPGDNKPSQDGAAMEYVTMKTSMGDIVLELDRAKAPITVENFLAYVDADAYDSTIFHRVIPGFMIQGGGFSDDMTKRPTREPIQNEWQNGLKNTRGSIAMARRGGQANSATNQFFINVKNNGSLDVPRDGAGYAVFGRVVKGMDVVDDIKTVKTHQLDGEMMVINGKKQKVPGRRDVPVDPVYILDVVRTEKPADMTE